MADKVRKVFLVDDDASHNQMLKDHLSSKLNIEITTFTSGEDCLRNMEQLPNVVVLDYNLDGDNKGNQNGVDILKKIKSAQPQTEVIMLSGQERIQVAVDSMKHGAFDYVVKNESAFVRTQNVITNIFKGVKLQENLKLYKTTTYVLAAVVVIIVIAAVVLVKTGVSKDDPGWVGQLISTFSGYLS